MDDYIGSQVSADYAFSASRSAYLARQRQPIYVLEIAALTLSSTVVRRRIGKGLPIDDLVTIHHTFNSPMPAQSFGGLWLQSAGAPAWVSYSMGMMVASSDSIRLASKLPLDNSLRDCR